MTKEEMNKLRNDANLFPKAFIKLWCIENKVNQREMLAAKRHFKRMECIGAIKKAFPRLTASNCSLLFGLDHSTILNAWKKTEISYRKRKTSENARPLSEERRLQMQEKNLERKQKVHIAKQKHVENLKV